MHQHRLGVEWLESSSAENNLRDLMNNYLTIRQLCVLVAKRPMPSWIALGKVLSTLSKVSFSLLGPAEALVRVMGSHSLTYKLKCSELILYLP